jgi:hypothetical protein
MRYNIFPVLLFSYIVFSCSTSPSVSSPEPAWVQSWDAYYGMDYIAAVGYGKSRREAENAALAALTARFEQSVQVDLQTMVAYREAVQDGVISISSDTTINNAIKTSASIDTLVGAEIRDTWNDGELYYASVIMDREKTIAVYTGIISANLETIETLTVIDESEKYTFEGLARYKLAAVIAEANQFYANLLSVADTGENTPKLQRGNSYYLEIENIKRNMVIFVRTDEEPQTEIIIAFQKIVNQQEFQTTVVADGVDYKVRYELNIQAAFNESPVVNSRYKFIDWTVTAALTDTQKKTVLLSYKIDGREGYANIEGAKQRSVEEAEKQIAEHYGPLFANWLSSLSPEK